MMRPTQADTTLMDSETRTMPDDGMVAMMFFLSIVLERGSSLIALKVSNIFGFSLSVYRVAFPPMRQAYISA